MKEEIVSCLKLHEKYAFTSKTERYTGKKIEAVAPAWAAAIGSRDGIHGETVCPDTIEQAWKWKQFAGIIEEITAEPIRGTAEKSCYSQQELRLKTAELAANKPGII